MNVNLLTIDALPQTTARPVCPSQTRNTPKEDKYNGLGYEDSRQVSVSESSFADKHAEQTQRASSASREEQIRSDNNVTSTHETDRNPQEQDFDRVLKRRLKEDETNGVQIDVADSAENTPKAPNFMLKVNSQDKPAGLEQTETGNHSSGQATSNIAGNSTVASQKVISTEIQSKITGQEQTQTSGETKSSNNTNTAGPGKIIESANQQKQEADGTSNQPGTAQPKVQFADLSTMRQAPGTIEPAGRQSGSRNAQNEHTKNELSGDGQKNTQNLSQTIPDSGQGAGKPIEKLNAEKAEVLLGATVTAKPESGNGTAQSNSGTIPNPVIAQVTTAGRPFAADQSAAAANNSSNFDNASAIREQIYQSVQTSVQQGQNQITIHLNPPELGRVSVKFSQQGNELTGMLEATNPQTRAEISQALPEIIRSLEQSGINIKRIDVMLSDQPRQSNQESLRDNSSQNLWEQFANNGSQDGSGNRPSSDSYVNSQYLGQKSEAAASSSFDRNQQHSSSSDMLLDVLI